MAIGWLAGCVADPEPRCAAGVWPYVGQSAVPIDAPLRVELLEVLPAELPPLEAGVRLRSGDERLSVGVDVVNGVLEVRPDPPLERNRTYVLTAFDGHAVRRAVPAWHAPSGWGGRPEETTFYTGSAPHLRGIVVMGWLEERELVAAFSQPPELASLEGRLQLDSAEDRRLPAVLGLYEGQPHLVRLEPVEGVVEARLLDGVITPGGLPFAEDRVRVDPELPDPQAVLDRLSGEPWCGTWPWSG